MKYFLAGTAIALIGVLVAYLLNDWSLIYMISGIVAGVALIWGVLALGTGKNKSTRTTSSEKRREKQQRVTKMKNAVMVAVPNIIAVIVNLAMIS
ncbi:hypothetical protein GPDM_15414 [Planococcus donghaensis MPA1U2]|uniref:Uncharacterized protein n=1 Tax=Planococcus donghaensis MPA1U2 TaxID=933115 RepID=E7RKQ8_9BACL|nr:MULTISPECIES: DUF5316 domain-containing protein [Planococcus]EGA88488.1 hypothetical protein GPDM_15414 [Planococcus donghaensis MPA1U2]MCH4826706.1 DUF5316 domain-containing protein [Planococcus halocryophilus]